MQRPSHPPAAANSPSYAKGGSGHGLKAAKRAALLTDIPITGTLADGGTFAGTITATKLAVDPLTQQLSMTGVVNGTATKTTGEAFSARSTTFSPALPARSAQRVWAV